MDKRNTTQEEQLEENEDEAMHFAERILMIPLRTSGGGCASCGGCKNVTVSSGRAKASACEVFLQYLLLRHARANRGSCGGD